MNGRTITPGVLIGAVALLAALPYGHAAPEATVPASKTGIVSVRDVFNNSKKHAQYRGGLLKRQATLSAQLDELAKQVADAEADLKTLKPGTADYIKQYQAMLEARSRQQIQQDLIKQQRMAEDKKWFEDLYQEALKATQELAKERGLELVLERTVPEFPIASEELWSTVGTHKVLYCGGCVDLTGDVTARVDASETLKP
ncbi:MAG: OmpH family outer membrane protein [Planctomycetes bacterium]|jgi:Skp family chaperone for outer membrane proteins|nr:OmpH family outer membrane protein [Planctomycetota bacterium]